MRRRFTFAAALALLAGLALSGCRTDPSVAAYIGTEVITEAYIDQVIDEMRATSSTAAPGQAAPPQLSRSDVLSQLVLGRSCAILQAKQGFKGSPVTADNVAQAVGVPASSEYAKERAKTESCLSGLTVGTAETPSDAEMQDIYDRAKAKGLVEVPLSEIRDQLAAAPELQQAVAAKRVIAQLVADGDVSVNPRYRPMEFALSDLGSGAPLVVAILGEPGSDAVHDLT